MSEATVATLLGALLPLALTALVAWLERRGQNARRNTAIDIASKRVEFLQLYLEAQRLALPPEPYETLKQTVSGELDRTFQELSRVLGGIEQMADTNEKNVVERVLLLYPLQKPRSKIFRVLFYALLILSTGMSLLFALGTLNNPSQTTNFITATIGISVLLLPLIALALLLRWLAIH